MPHTQNTHYVHLNFYLGLSWWLSGKESTRNSGDVGSITGLGRSPGERNGNSLQCSCLGNPMDRGAWRARVHGAAKELDTTWHLNSNSNILTWLLDIFHYAKILFFKEEALNFSS